MNENEYDGKKSKTLDGLAFNSNVLFIKINKYIYQYYNHITYLKYFHRAEVANVYSGYTRTPLRFLVAIFFH